MYNVGDTIAGEYAVSHVFTNGGMGVVYKVHRASWDVDMAMKCPRPELFESEEQRKGFVNECETWMDLGAHPNIISCYYVTNIDSVPTVLMEYADGGSLLDSIRSGRLYDGSPDIVLKRILDYAIQSARGLFHAHSKGYVHQDVKPANVLLTHTGVAKVSDFGLAKAKGYLSKAALSSDERSMVVSSGGWTPAYGSPEQASGHPLTRRTDIWSWAAMMLEMIHGEFFWKIGPLAAQELKKLWPWQIFSSRVMSCRGLVNILRECLEEREDCRPKDFDVIEEKLLALYKSTFDEPYPRHLPPSILMTEASLSNRIASYAELEANGGDYFSKVYECRSKLREVSPWAIWGDLNYAAYCHAHGMTVPEIFQQVENQLRRANTDQEKEWLLNLLVSLGVTSSRDPLVKMLRLDENSPLLGKLHEAHESMRNRLIDVFKDEPERHDRDDNSSAFSCEHRSGVSEGGTVSVCVDRQLAENGKTCLKLTVKVREKVFEFVDRCLPDRYTIERITTDDRGVKICLWLSGVKQGWHQKVYALEGEKIISYQCDFRKTERWGSPEAVYQTGDAKIMMLRYFGDVVSLWINECGDDGDGRNVCVINLGGYGLSPAESMLPGLCLDECFGYEVSDAAAYRLMRMLARVYGPLHIPCHISRPDVSSVEIERSNECYSLFALLEQSMRTQDDGRLVQLVSQCLEHGVLPGESIMDRRHRTAVSRGDIRLARCWHATDVDEYWENPIEDLQSFCDNSIQMISFGYRPRKLAIEDRAFRSVLYEWDFNCCPYMEVLKDPSFIPICGCENGDIIIAICTGWDVFSIRRIAKAGRNNQRVVWDYRAPSDLGRLKFLHGFAQTEKWVSFLQYDNTIVFLSKDGGIAHEIDFRGRIDFWSIDFSPASPIALFVMGDEQIVMRDSHGHDIDKANVIRKFVQDGKLRDLSIDGARILVEKAFDVRVCDLQSGEAKVIYALDPFVESQYGASSVRSCAMSPNGLAVAVVTQNMLLKVFDVCSGREVMEWKLPPGSYGSLCFDRSGRWLCIVRDQKKIEVFQLFWESAEIQRILAKV